MRRIFQQRVCSYAWQSTTYQQYSPEMKAARFVVHFAATAETGEFCRVDPWLPIWNHEPNYTECYWTKVREVAA